MKLADAVRLCRIPEDADDKWRYEVPTDDICQSLGVQDMWSFPDEISDALKAYPLFNWLCTDEHVGLDAIYFQGEPAGSLWRSGRKMGYEVKWISEEMAKRVRGFILDHAERPQFEVIDADECVDEECNVEFVSQSLTDKGIFEGRPVKALVWYDGLMGMTTPEHYRVAGRPYTQAVPYNDSKSNCILVQDGDTQIVIHVEDFKIPLNLK